MSATSLLQFMQGLNKLRKTHKLILLQEAFLHTGGGGGGGCTRVSQILAIINFSSREIAGKTL